MRAWPELLIHNPESSSEVSHRFQDDIGPEGQIIKRRTIVPDVRRDSNPLDVKGHLAIARTSVDGGGGGWLRPKGDQAIS